MEVDDAERFAGREVEGVAVGWGDDVGFCFRGWVEEGEGGEDMGWVGELRGKLVAGFGFGFVGLGCMVSLCLASMGGYGGALALFSDWVSDCAGHGFGYRSIQRKD